MEITDPELFAKYVRGHQSTLTKYGGRFLARGAQGEILEGAFPKGLVVIHEFPDRQKWLEWYYSEEYAPWKQLRHQAAITNVLLVEGI